MLTDSKEIAMQTVTAENKTSEAISENYRDTQAGIYLRLMTHEDTDRIVAWRNSDVCAKILSIRSFLPDSPMSTGSGPMWRPEMWYR